MFYRNATLTVLALMLAAIWTEQAPYTGNSALKAIVIQYMVNNAFAKLQISDRWCEETESLIFS